MNLGQLITANGGSFAATLVCFGFGFFLCCAGVSLTYRTVRNQWRL